MKKEEEDVVVKEEEEEEEEERQRSSLYSYPQKEMKSDRLTHGEEKKQKKMEIRRWRR